jgi:hypothetical protein
MVGERSERQDVMQLARDELERWHALNSKAAGERDTEFVRDFNAQVEAGLIDPEKLTRYCEIRQPDSEEALARARRAASEGAEQHMREAKRRARLARLRVAEKNPGADFMCCFPHSGEVECDQAAQQARLSVSVKASGPEAENFSPLRDWAIFGFLFEIPHEGLLSHGWSAALLKVRPQFSILGSYSVAWGWSFFGSYLPAHASITVETGVYSAALTPGKWYRSGPVEIVHEEGPSNSLLQFGGDIPGMEVMAPAQVSSPAPWVVVMVYVECECSRWFGHSEIDFMGPFKCFGVHDVDVDMVQWQP